MSQKFTLNVSSALVALAVFLTFAGNVTAESWKEEVIHGFQGQPSAFPAAGLVTDGSGNLYGTSSGYDSQSGTVFRLDVPRRKGGHWVIDTLHSFEGNDRIDGKGPEGGVVFDKEGNVYGTTFYGVGANGGGTIFRLKPPAKKGGRWTETILHAFDGCTDGCGPGGLIFGKEGALYGTTLSGGAFKDGTVYELLRQGAEDHWTFKVLHNFAGPDGSEPLYSGGNLAIDKQGSLYGVTAFGGAYDAGVVFRLAPSSNGDGWTESVLYTFTGGNDGGGPNGGLIFDDAGKLYGTTRAGGPSSGGTVFELTPSKEGSWTETVLNSFSGNGGDGPWGRLIFDKDGNLYGTTLREGPNLGGTVFRLKPPKRRRGSWTGTTLHKFSGLHDGGLPLAGLTFDKHGALYGTTYSGGDLKTCSAVRGCGTIFKIYRTK